MRKNNKDTNRTNNQTPKDFVGSLIKSQKSKASKSSKRSDSKQTESKKETHYALTPKGVMYKALCDALGKQIDINQFDKFIANFLCELSLLSSGGNNKDLFSLDFNCFFTTVVQTMNLCGLLKEILDENGIEVDIKELLERGQDDEDEDVDGE